MDYNGNDKLKSWVRAIGYIGVPSVIAMGLVYNMAVTQARDIVEARVQLSQHAEESRVHATVSANNMARIELLLRFICQNTAKTAQDRTYCWQ